MQIQNLVSIYGLRVLVTLVIVTLSSCLTSFLGPKRRKKELTSFLVIDIHIKEPEGDVLIFMTGQVR